MRKRERRLRSPREGDSQLFDYDLSELNYDAPLVLVNLPSGGSGRRGSGPAPKTEPSEPHAKTEPVKTELPANSADPLDPGLFLGHHRRMDREERRMQQLERQQLLVEFGRVTQQRAQLQSPDWPSYISRIVRIVDPDDDVETAQKRALAIAEIDRFLYKYNELKKRRAGSTDDSLAPSQSPPPQPPKKQKKKPPQPPKKPATPPVTLSLRPTAFGYMLPFQLGRPREFALPREWTD